jgi:hypothetical protein
MSVCCQHLVRALYTESLVPQPGSPHTRSRSDVREGLGIRPGLLPFISPDSGRDESPLLVGYSSPKAEGVWEART